MNGLPDLEGITMLRTPAAIVALAGSSLALSQSLFPAELDLSSLDGSNGFVINGIDAGDGSGGSISCAGDINEDGIDDLIIGARGGDPNGDSYAGESYVVFGGMGVGASGSFDLSSLDGSNGFVINGADESHFSGTAVSSAGDINGDGADDLLIGAPNVNPFGNFYAGATFVVFGGAGVGASGSINLSSLNGSNGFVLNGIDAYDTSGRAVSSAGDVNGDGFDDLIIGVTSADPDQRSSAGESYVVFGGANVGATGSLRLNLLSGPNDPDGFVLTGITDRDFSGRSVSCAGDVNGDGVDDLIIGADGADPNGNLSAGESYVVFGGGVSSGTFRFDSLDGSNGFAISGIDREDESGFSVSGAGDINGDGANDLIIGAGDADPNGTGEAGESYVVFGGAGVVASGTFQLSSIDGSNGFVIHGIDASDRSGHSVSMAGDVNGDGADDLVIGATLADPNGTVDAGESYVVFGGAGVGASGVIELSSLDGANGFVVSGIDEDDRSGDRVSAAGDFNGDGVDDFIIGAERGDPNGNDGAGESYVVFGRAPSPADLNGDGCVGGADLAILVAAWGSMDVAADLDESGVVGGEDLALLIAAWSTGCG